MGRFKQPLFCKGRSCWLDFSEQIERTMHLSTCLLEARLLPWAWSCHPQLTVKWNTMHPPKCSLPQRTVSRTTPHVYRDLSLSTGLLRHRELISSFFNHHQCCQHYHCYHHHHCCQQYHYDMSSPKVETWVCTTPCWCLPKLKTLPSW